MLHLAGTQGNIAQKNIAAHQPPIAERLKQGEEMIADRYEQATVLFADIANFTPLSARLAPERVARAALEMPPRWSVLLATRTCRWTYASASTVGRSSPG